jgi:adenine phosphoribosyltransferase
VDYYTLEIDGLKRQLPIITLGPKIKVASFNLLGDEKLVEILAKKLVAKIKKVEFDYLVGPEVKVVPLLHELSKILHKDRYVICRKEIHGYMVSPIKSQQKQGLVINGSDADLVKNKKVIIVDDVVSTGSTIHSIEELMKLANAKVVAKIAVFRQGNQLHPLQKDLIYLDELPVFTS